jgi:hypothetical protein
MKTYKKLFLALVGLGAGVFSVPELAADPG